MQMLQKMLLLDVIAAKMAAQNNFSVMFSADFSVVNFPSPALPKRWLPHARLKIAW